MGGHQSTKTELHVNKMRVIQKGLSFKWERVGHPSDAGYNTHSHYKQFLFSSYLRTHTAAKSQAMGNV